MERSIRRPGRVTCTNDLTAFGWFTLGLRYSFRWCAAPEHSAPLEQSSGRAFCFSLDVMIHGQKSIR
jgi:hypothetical protein